MIDSLILAGAEALVKDMVPRMRARGVEVTVAVLKNLDSPFEHELRGMGIPFLPTAEGGIYSPEHIFSLARHCRDFDLVHAYLFPAQFFILLARELARSKVPVILSEQNTHHRRQTFWLSPVEHWMYPRYASIACASEGIAESVRVRLPEVADKITVIPNGIDVPRFENAEAAPRESITRSSEPLFIYTARLEPQKDHGTTLRALAKVRRGELVLVGDGVLMGEMRALARSLGIEERVHFLGRRKDVPQLLKMADVYVHVSAFEGFGIAAAEAMAAGLPVIASNVAGMAQVVGDAGILLPPGNVDALAEAMNMLGESPQRRAEMSAASVQRARKFSIEVTVQSFLELYETILASHSGTGPNRS